MGSSDAMTIRKSPSSLAIVLSLFAVAALVMGQTFLGYGVDANIPFVVTGNTTIAKDHCQGTILAGTGSTGQFTLTLPAVTGFPSNCSVLVKNGDTTNGKILSGFPLASSPILWPKQTIGVKIVNGVWHGFYNPGAYIVPPGGTTIFASPSGVDTNDGLTASTPVTFSGACSLRTQFATFFGAITIKLADGTYSTPVNGALCVIQGNAGGSSLLLTSIQGNSVTPTNVVLAPPSGSGGIIVQDIGEAGINNLEITAVNGSGPGIQCRQLAVCDYNNITWGAWGNSGAHLSVTGGASANPGNETLLANGIVHWNLSDGAHLTAGGTTTIPSAVDFSAGAFLQAVNSNVDVGSWTLTGSGVAGTTGQRAALVGIGYLTTAGNAACNSVFPGNGGCALTQGYQDAAGDLQAAAYNLQANSVSNAKLALGAANTLKGTLNGSSNTDIAVPACTGALVWTAGVGFVCNVGTGTGTVTEQKNTASGGAVTSGNCDNINSNASSPCNVAVSGGFLNVLRNNSLSAWFHGTSITITTAGGWCAEGVWVVPTGASVTCAQATGGNNGAPYYNVTITGAASVTDVKIRFVVESLQAALLTAQNTTFQMQWVNGTGGTVTPTLATKYPTAQDNWTSSTADLTATNLQACNSAAICTPAYTLAVSNSATTGYEFVVDLGNNFSTNGKTAKIIYFDARVSPGVATGLNATPPPFEMRDPASDTSWNERFYQTTYDNGVAPGTATHVGMVGTSGTATTNVGQMGNVFRTTMRCDPIVSFWDGAGTPSKLSFWNSSNWTDGNNANSPAVIPSSAGHRGFIFYNNNNANFSFHYAADCTISGG
jgi:hypothetical protein